LSKERREAIAHTAKAKSSGIKIKSHRRIEGLQLDELLSLYYEKRGLSKVAQSLGVTASILKTYLRKHSMWDRLIALDDQMRLENPSINMEAKIYKLNNNS
jgi:hypothetical protein